MIETHLFLPVADAYDRWSGFYDHYDNPMVFGAERVVQHLAASVAGLTVVECGCGTGRNLAALKQAGAARLVGCDLSPGMLAEARAREPEVEWLRHDLNRPLPLPAASADLVLFSLTLEHVADLAPPLNEARRLLRPGGRVVVIEIHPFLSLSQVAAHFRDQDTVVTMPTFAHRFADYLNAAADSGLQITRCREWRPCDFPGPLPPKLLKRGPEMPLLVEFHLQPGGPVGAADRDPSL